MTRWVKGLCSLGVAAAVVLFAGVSRGAGLYVDFGCLGCGRIGLQQGYQAFEGGAESTPSPMSQDFLSPLGLGGVLAVSVSVAPDGAALGWRDREALSGPLAAHSELLSDFVLAFSAYGAQTLELQLSTLLAGHYRITTYHHDSGFNDHGDLNVRVDDASGTSIVATHFAQSTGNAPASIGVLHFEVTADGVNPITVRFEQIQGNAVILNGFDLEPSAPIAATPSTWSLMKGLFRR